MLERLAKAETGQEDEEGIGWIPVIGQRFSLDVEGEESA